MYLARGSSESAVLAAIDDDIAWLQRNGIRRIVLFGPGPTWDTSLAVDLFRIMRRERMEYIPERIETAAESVRQLDAAMAAQPPPHISGMSRFYANFAIPEDVWSGATGTSSGPTCYSKIETT